ncbi:MAG: flagellar export chaperone FlgN [Pseudomonadota bacterium]|nr:flagellar export chaperone FlgN [Pseudomonadota bacterium]
MPTSAEIDAFKRDISALRTLLEKEFEALKNQRFNTFEQHMKDKTVILNRLSESSILERLKARSEQTTGYDEDSRTLDILHSALAECKNLHNRNEVLIRHKILAIRETLDSFSVADNPLAETYDSLGNINRGIRKRPRNF